MFLYSLESYTLKSIDIVGCLVRVRSQPEFHIFLMESRLLSGRSHFRVVDGKQNPPSRANHIIQMVKYLTQFPQMLAYERRYNKIEHPGPERQGLGQVCPNQRDLRM